MDHSEDTFAHVRALYEISTLIESGSDLSEMFPRALEIIRDIVGCHAASLFIMDAETGRLNEAASLGGRVELIEEVPFDLGNGFSAWVAKERRTVLLPNLRREPGDGYRSFMSTPMLSKNGLIGVLNLGHKEFDGLSEAHVPFMEIIAAQFAAGIERANYERRLVEQNETLIAAREEIEKQQHIIVEMEKYQVLGQMTVSINHEINNPLTTVIGNLDLLLLTHPDMDEQIKSKLNIALSEAHRIAKIVEKLRNIKRIVIEDYLEDQGEKMINIESSIVVEKGENHS